MTKPLVELTERAIDVLPAQLGVYEIVDADGATQKLGFAGGHEAFGMRTALARELAIADDGHAAWFRHEFTHGYMTRWQELLMVYQADHGSLPPGNQDETITLGRLSPMTDDTRTS